MEVMGLMLGEFVDEYTVKVVDVFAMPQSGTGVSVEAVDPVFQMKMLEMLKQVRPATFQQRMTAAPATPCPRGSIADVCAAIAAQACASWRSAGNSIDATTSHVLLHGHPCVLQSSLHAGWEARNGGGVVSLASGLWLLAVWR